MSDLIRKQMFHELLRVRMIEERIVELYSEQEMRCPTHFSLGQEAIAVGVCAHLSKKDFVMSAHRSHAHYLAKGGDLKRMMAELYGKVTGCARGKGGSMHLIDQSVGFLGCVPIVGSTIPIGVGIAFGNKLQKKNPITVIFFGDGAVETGVFHESINYAALHKLPVLFVCENNFYSVNTPLPPRQPENRNIVDVVKGHGMEAIQIDGQDCDTVFEATQLMLDKIRLTNRPAFLEFFTYRWLEHCGPFRDPIGFRPEKECEYWFNRDPVHIFREKLINEGILTNEDVVSINNQINDEISEAVLFAKSSPFPNREELHMGVYPEAIKEHETCPVEV